MPNHVATSIAIVTNYWLQFQAGLVWWRNVTTLEWVVLKMYTHKIFIKRFTETIHTYDNEVIAQKKTKNFRFIKWVVCLHYQKSV